MEEQAFPDAAVAALLKSKFIEVRLHAENQQRLPAEKRQRFLDLRDALVGSVAIPAYAILDPRTEKSLGFYQLDGTKLDGWKSDFIALFEQAIQRSQGQ